MKAVVVGDLSGLQNFIFTLTPGEGGQAKRLRARSFFIQVLAEGCALRFLTALGWTRSKLVFCGAAKFVLIAESLADATTLQRAAAEINRWLLAETGGQLNFAWAMQSGDASESALWNSAMLDLQRTKLRPWADAAQSDGAWQSSALVLDYVKLDAHNRPQVPELRVFDDKKIGGLLPAAYWLEIRADTGDSNFNLLGYGCKLHAEPNPPALRDDALLLFALGRAAPAAGAARTEQRWLARHVPTKPSDELVTFEELADAVTGDTLLGALKMDVDSLGVAFEARQKAGPEAVRELSQRLDTFFSRTLDEERRASWQNVYTVFSGGDDMLVVAPWDIAFHYAGHVQQRFHREFGREKLTISAGLSLFKPKFPIQRAAEHAEELIDQAKAAGKNRFAAFGEIWPWNPHQSRIAHVAKCLAGDVNAQRIQRGWLQEILGFAESRSKTLHQSDELATARLAYQCARKYRDRDFTDWVKRLIDDFDSPTETDTQFLAAILRHALTATRAVTR